MCTIASVGGNSLQSSIGLRRSGNRRGAVAAMDAGGDPVLHAAVWQDQAATARMLIDAGTDVNGTDGDGDPLLHEAIWRDHYDIARILIDAGADGDPLLHEAVWRDMPGIVRILIDAGADLYAPSAYGSSPLEAARQLGHTEVMQLLVDAGTTE